MSKAQMSNVPEVNTNTSSTHTQDTLTRIDRGFVTSEII